MSNPLFGQGANYYNYPSQETKAIKFGPYTLYLQENRNRHVLDTTTSTLVPQPPPSSAPCSGGNNNALACQVDTCPTNATYTYRPQAQEFAMRGFTSVEQPQPPGFTKDGGSSSLQYQIALKELEKQCLETMLLREQILKNPYSLKFTENSATLTDSQLLRFIVQREQQNGCICCQVCPEDLQNGTTSNSAVGCDISEEKMDEGKVDECEQTEDIGLPPLDLDICFISVSKRSLSQSSSGSNNSTDEDEAGSCSGKRSKKKTKKKLRFSEDS